MNDAYISKKLNNAPAYLLAQLEEERQVVLHCSAHADDYGMRLRIWRNCVLSDPYTGHESRLVHVEGISIAPQWTDILPGQTAHFTLVFQGLPSDCNVFDFFEKVAEEGRFEVCAIRRNKMDVYHINLQI